MSCGRAHRPAGLANPGPIIAELWTDEELEAAVTLDGVVTLVDGRNVTRQLGEMRPAGQPNEAQLQVALADIILLNKVGLSCVPLHWGKRGGGGGCRLLDSHMRHSCNWRWLTSFC